MPTRRSRPATRRAAIPPGHPRLGQAVHAAGIQRAAVHGTPGTKTAAAAAPSAGSRPGAFLPASTAACIRGRVGAMVSSMASRVVVIQQVSTWIWRWATEGQLWVEGCVSVRQHVSTAQVGLPGQVCFVLDGMVCLGVGLGACAGSGAGRLVVCIQHVGDSASGQQGLATVGVACVWRMYLSRMDVWASGNGGCAALVVGACAASGHAGV